MKNIITILLFLFTLSCKSQTYPLRTYMKTPENSYLKDTNNELQFYEGIWKGEWNNKIVYIKFNTIVHKYMKSVNKYRDMLVGRYKLTDLNGNVLFDNMNISDNEIKIFGTRFRKEDDKYDLIYIDQDLCNRSGTILINFTDSTKTKLQWIYWQNENFIRSDCFYYNWAPADVPQPLPNDIILTKQ